MSVQKFDCRSLPIQKVTVLTDRAEVKRIVALQLQEGVTEIQLQNVTSQMIEDSVRVNGRGSATILEVMKKETHIVKGQSDPAKVAAKREEAKKKTLELGEAMDEKTVLDKKLDLLQNVVGTIGDKTNPLHNASAASINDATIEGLEKLFEFYGDTSTEVRKELRKTKGKVEKLDEELRKLKNELEVLEYGGNSTIMRSIVVVVESDASGGGAAELSVIYQTRGASWSPKYDIRVDTDEATKKMQIHYFGSVKQTTGEDWNDCDLVLSTAQPNLAGDVPELGTLEVSIRPPPPPPRSEYYGWGQKVATYDPVYQTLAGIGGDVFGSDHKKDGPRVPQNVAQKAGTYDPNYQTLAGIGGDVFGADQKMAAGGRSMSTMSVATAETKENVMSSEFTIARKKPIPSDHDEHKIHHHSLPPREVLGEIGVLTLEPRLSYECVPSKSTSVFLMAHAVNTSEYALLSGAAAVYFNGAFIAKTHLKAVSPSEKFVCSLGVDTAVRIDRRPTKTYHEQLGIISKTSSTITEKTVSVKNAKNKPLLFTMKENIPRSNDQRITVSVISPSIASVAATSKTNEIPTEGILMSSANNLEWTTTIPAQNTKEFLVKYKVEHPTEEKKAWRRVGEAHLAVSRQIPRSMPLTVAVVEPDGAHRVPAE